MICKNCGNEVRVYFINEMPPDVIAPPFLEKMCICDVCGHITEERETVPTFEWKSSAD